MVDRTLHLLAGEVRVEVCGGAVERFLNLCAKGGIQLRGTRRIDINRLQTTLSISDFRRLRGLMGRTGCRVHILRRRGAPFVLRRLRRRYVLLLGGVLMGVLFYLLTSCVWVVEIQAPDGVSTAALRQQLRENGVYAGARIADIDMTLVRHRVKQASDDISYLTISRTGNYVLVTAYEAARDIETIDEDLPVGVVAARDGVIKEMVVRDGNPLKQVGDAVLKGDLLVGALMPPNTEQGLPRLTRAMASVTAGTTRQETALRSLIRQEKQYTGKETTQFAIVIGQMRINLYFGSGITAGTCDKIISTTQLRLGRGLVLPVTLVRQTYRFYETETVTVDADTAAQEMEQAALARMESDMIAGQIDRYETAFEALPGAMQMTIRAECTEEIGVEMEDDTPLPPPPAPEETPDDQ